MEPASFEWFTLENKVRDLVLELIDSATKKSELQKQFEDALEDSIKEHKLKLEDIEIRIDRLARKFTLIDALSKRQLEFESSQRAVNMKMTEGISALQTQLDSFNHYSVSVASSVRSFDTQLTVLAEVSKQAIDEILKVKAGFLDKLQQTKEYFEDRLIHQQSEVRLIEETLAAAKKNFDGINSSIVGVDVKAMTCEQEIKFIQLDIQTILKGGQLKPCHCKTSRTSVDQHQADFRD